MAPMDIHFRSERAILSNLSFTLPTSKLEMCCNKLNLWCYWGVGVLDKDWISYIRPRKERRVFLRLLHNKKQRALFAFLTIVPVKSQVYLQQQTKQSSSRNIQGLKVLGKKGLIYVGLPSEWYVRTVGGCLCHLGLSSVRDCLVDCCYPGLEDLVHFRSLIRFLPSLPKLSLDGRRPILHPLTVSV